MHCSPRQTVKIQPGVFTQTPSATSIHLLKEALNNHHSGRLVIAEQLYRETLRRDPNNADSYHLLGLLLHQTNRSELAGKLLRKAIALNKMEPAYYSNLGLILEEQGKFHDAKAQYKRALALQPSNADILYKLGCVLQRQEKLEDAADQYRRALSLNPDYVAAHCNLSVSLHAQGKTTEAFAHINKAVLLQPSLAEAHYNLGTFLQSQGSISKAIVCYEKAISLKPTSVDPYINLAILLYDTGQTLGALLCYKKALVLAPDNATLHLNVGITLCTLNKIEEGTDHIERSLALNPRSVEAYYNLGLSLCSLDRMKEGIIHYERALTLNPSYAEAYNNLGTTFDARNTPAAAIYHYQRALESDPNLTEAHYNLAMSQLSMGDFANGWRNYEWRWLSKKSPLEKRAFSQPQWQGEPLKGARILLHAEQGLGDTIQFLRYVPVVQAAGGNIVLEVQGRLRPLAAAIPGITELIARDESLPPFDLHCPLMSLPLALGTTLDTVPHQVPYLRVPENARKAASDLSWPLHGLKVGLVWAGKQTFVRDRYRYRSIPLSLFSPLLGRAGIHVFSLQYGESTADLKQFAGLIHDLSPYANEMADTAAHIEKLDLVISVDTSVAHLAGALGAATWTLLPYASDWRWGVAGQKNSWYPTMRLFRQSTPGNWDSVITEVTNALVRYGEQLI